MLSHHLKKKKRSEATRSITVSRLRSLIYSKSVLLTIKKKRSLKSGLAFLFYFFILETRP